MNDSDEPRKDIIAEFSNKYVDGSVILYRKYRGHKLFEFLEQEDWESVIKTLEEILKNKYSQISDRALAYKEYRYADDEWGGEIYIERIRRIQERKQINIKSLIEKCKNI